eukprot:XP_011662821.1 PREDICTED: uncharacterized protein LOC105437660 [Strongylocentrotus purpuratus]
MADSSTESGRMLQYLLVKKVDVCVCSGSHSDNVQGLIQQIEEDMTDVVRSVRFQTLPFNMRNMDAFDFSGMDVLLLCHSIDNRGFSLTNVNGALYDGFLQKAKKYVGKSKVGVIAHDFPEEVRTAENLSSRMESFRTQQKTSFTTSSVVLIGGRLNQVPVELNQEQINELEQFFRFASSPPPEEAAEVCLRRQRCILCLPCVLCCMKMCPCVPSCMMMCPCCRPQQDAGRLVHTPSDYGSNSQPTEMSSYSNC